MSLFRSRPAKIHFVGIGGIGMSGIAEVLLNLGYHVSGSDLAATTVTERLAVLGGRIAVGHAAANVSDAQVVVVLPWAPAIAMPYFMRISSASISARGITGIWRRCASCTSGLSAPTADEITTTCALPRLEARCPSQIRLPSSSSRRVTGPSFRSDPETR